MGYQAIPNPPLNRPNDAYTSRDGASELIAALASGGDARITLKPDSGLNKYMSAPYPREVLAYSSSTVSDISDDAFAHLLAINEAENRRSYGEWLADLKVRILSAYELAHDTDMVFAPSGTDLEYVALAAVQGRARGGIHNILLGADEIGSGCIHSAHGRYFAQETALLDGLAAAQDVEGFGPISLVDVPVRCERGKACTSAEIAKSMSTEIRLAQGEGKHSLVHCVHGSKTGLVLPNGDDLAGLIEEFGDDATFVVDACQARITSEAVAKYLERGCIVLMTGSKFMGAPPFNGWAMLPPGMAERAEALPAGFSTIFRRAEFPECWAGADSLPDSGNLSLALRLEAAVFELERFQKIPMVHVEAMIGMFETALTDHLVEPLGIRRVLPGEGMTIADRPIEMRTLATLDVSDLAGMRTFDEAQALHKKLAEEGIRLGQPVKCVRLEEGWGGTLRVGLSMPQMSRWAGMANDAVEAELARDMTQIAAALQHSHAKTA